MNTNHTPGPWVTDTCGEGKPFAIVTSTHLPDGPDDDVCEVYGGNDDDDLVRQANAKLIAAAPDMLKALYRLTHPAADDTDLEFALQVIDQATGGSQ